MMAPKTALLLQLPPPSTKIWALSDIEALETIMGDITLLLKFNYAISTTTTKPCHATPYYHTLITTYYYHIIFPRSKNSKHMAAEACQLFSADVCAAVACNYQYTPALS